MQTKTPRELIDFSVKLHKTLRYYLDTESWTPVMGAMLLAGMHPPADCTDLPRGGGVGLDGVEIVGAGNTQYYEARTIVHQWKDWCEDRGSYPTEINYRVHRLVCRGSN